MYCSSRWRIILWNENYDMDWFIFRKVLKNEGCGKHGLVSRGWCCDEAIVRLVRLCWYRRLAMWYDVYIMKKENYRSCFVNFRKKTLYAQRSHENERFACIKASQMAKKWMRLKMFQHTQNHRKNDVDQL